MSVTPSASYSLTLRVELENEPGMLGEVTSAIGDAGGSVGAIDIVKAERGKLVRDITIDAPSQEHWEPIIESVRQIEGVELLDVTDRTFNMHKGGKIAQENKHPLNNRDDLSMAYTPGVARVCRAIHAEPELAFRYTIKRNYVAVVSDGSAMLGLG
jgi:malate dehydrogenase (oxaloacetate-decarboxylating)